jgi:hypothetical protein
MHFTIFNSKWGNTSLGSNNNNNGNTKKEQSQQFQGHTDRMRFCKEARFFIFQKQVNRPTIENLVDIKSR